MIKRVIKRAVKTEKYLANNILVRKAGGRFLQMLGLNVNHYYTMRKLLTAKNWLRARSDHASVSIRDGFAVFHDRGNTLIRRGLYYEPNTREALFALCVLDVQRGNTLQIADIGANIGLHTVFLARRFPDATIHAYDPSPQSVRYLRHTIDYNGLEERVHVYECALGAIAEEGSMELYTWGSESSADSLKNTHRVPGRTPVKISVPLTTLEKQYNIGVRPTVIKMDCEGGEMDVLRGAGDVFANLRPLVLTEFAAANITAFSVEPADLFKWIGDFNYKLFTEAFAPLVLPHDMVNAWARGEENFILLPNELGI